MPLDRARTVFGIHQMTAVNRDTGLPYGTVKVLGEAQGELSRDAIDLFGGSNPNPVDSEMGNITPDLSITVKEFAPFLYELVGYTRTTIASNASGEISSAIANKKGTSVVNSTTGIASASVKSGSEEDVKDGSYVVKAVTSTTVDVYAVFDNEFDRGSDLEYQDSLLKITESPLTITASAAVEIPGTGIELTGGSGIIDMKPGTDEYTAVFETRSPNEGGEQYTYGGTPEPIEFEMHLTSQNKSNGEYVREVYYRVKFTNIPAGMTEKEFQDAELTAKVLYDSSKGKLYDRFDLKKVA